MTDNKITAVGSTKISQALEMNTVASFYRVIRLWMFHQPESMIFNQGLEHKEEIFFSFRRSFLPSFN